MQYPDCFAESADVSEWGGGNVREETDAGAPHESRVLRLAIDKAVARLGWTPRWDTGRAVRETALWYRAWAGGASRQALARLSREQIARYLAESA